MEGIDDHRIVPGPGFHEEVSRGIEAMDHESDPLGDQLVDKRECDRDSTPRTEDPGEETIAGIIIFRLVSTESEFIKQVLVQVCHKCSWIVIVNTLADRIGNPVQLGKDILACHILLVVHRDCRGNLCQAVTLLDLSQGLGEELVGRWQAMRRFSHGSVGSWTGVAAGQVRGTLFYVV
jgi:hypothetical protein